MPATTPPPAPGRGQAPRLWGLLAALLVVPLAEGSRPMTATAGAGVALPPVAQLTAIDAYNRGVDQARAGNLRGALALYTTAISLNPGLIEAWYNRGLVKDKLGDPAGAVADFDRALAIRPRPSAARTAEIHVNRGVARRQLGDQQGALADVNAALALDPRNAIAWNNRGRLMALMGNWDAACRDFRQAAALGNTTTTQYLNSSAGAWCRNRP
ncbi:MAG: tetratricopeptide repeat protein [Cyanobacteriota bacterium]|nr:tetratricopeptide repeat protein [Cyanobacteriota bacterium]